MCDSSSSNQRGKLNITTFFHQKKNITTFHDLANELCLLTFKGIENEIPFEFAVPSTNKPSTNFGTSMCFCIRKTKGG